MTNHPDSSTEQLSSDKIKALFTQMSKMLEGTGMTVPPPIFNHMEGEFVNIDLEKGSMLLRFPVKNEFENPMGYMQGGMIAAAIDNALGPLSFMLAPPSVTKTMTLNYKRPIPNTLESILVHAQLDKKTDRELYLSAVVSSEVVSSEVVSSETETEIAKNSTIHATAEAVQVILGRRQTKNA